MKKLILATAIMGVMAFANSAQAALIDDFTVLQTVNNTTSGTTSSGTISGALGASSAFADRTYSANKTVAGNATAFTVKTIEANSLSISTDTGVKGVASLEWFKSSGVDLTDSGAASKIVFGDLNVEHGTNTLLLTLTDVLNAVSTFSYTFPAALDGSSDFYILFSALSGGANLAAIKDFKVDFGIVFAASDISFSFLESAPIPEPSVITLMGLALAGMAASRRRKA